MAEDQPHGRPLAKTGFVPELIDFIGSFGFRQIIRTNLYAELLGQRLQMRFLSWRCRIVGGFPIIPVFAGVYGWVIGHQYLPLWLLVRYHSAIAAPKRS
jgi:hypothetical protein